MIFDHTPDFDRQQDMLTREIMRQRWAENERQRSFDFSTPPTDQEDTTKGNP